MNRLKKKLTMKISLIYSLPSILYWSHQKYVIIHLINFWFITSKKTKVHLILTGIWKIWKAKKLLLNDDVVKNIADVIILVMWLMLESLLKSKDVLYQVSSNLGEVNKFYSSFSDMSQKTPPVFQKLEKPCLVQNPFLTLQTETLLTFIK